MLTKRLRSQGVMDGTLTIQNAPFIHRAVPSKHLDGFHGHHENRQGVQYNQGQQPKIAVLDCGMKYNILRFLLRHTPAFDITVVPYDYELIRNGQRTFDFDGIFVSNGPGDPSHAATTVRTLQQAMQLQPALPLFGICLGHQILALAAGAKTYKMKYGHPSMNQPCIDLRTTN